MTTLRELIEPQRGQIIEVWLTKCLEVYPADARQFFAKKKNRFANPVGAALKRGVSAFVDGLMRDESPKTLAGHLDEVVQMRSVQPLEPSTALGFVFLLKGVISERLAAGPGESDWAEALDGVSSKIDATALQLFNLYSKYRERVYEVRVNDVKRRVSGLLKRTSFFNSDDESDSALNSNKVNPDPGDNGPPGR